MMTALFNVLIAVSVAHVSPVVVHASTVEVEMVHVAPIELEPVHVMPVIVHPAYIPASAEKFGGRVERPRRPFSIWRLLTALFGAVFITTLFYALISRFNK